MFDYKKFLQSENFKFLILVILIVVVIWVFSNELKEKFSYFGLEGKVGSAFEKVGLIAAPTEVQGKSYTDLDLQINKLGSKIDQTAATTAALEGATALVDDLLPVVDGKAITLEDSFISTGYGLQYQLDSRGSSMKNASYDIRGDIPIPKLKDSDVVWGISTVDANPNKTRLVEVTTV